ncbi:MAG: hypothetical protein ACXW1S_02825 [Acidimicrobiia bacterium]
MSPPTPRKAFEHPGRFAIVAIGLMIVASLVVFVGMESDTKPTSDPDVLPSEIVSTQPAPGTLNKPQQAVAVDLRGDLTGVLIIDGVEIPEDQLSRPTQSSMAFQPGPEKEVARFSSGPHIVQVVFWPAIRTRDDAQTYTFGFRTTA